MSFNLNICVVCCTECGADGIVVTCKKIPVETEEIKEDLAEVLRERFIKLETKNYIKYSSNWTELSDGTKVCPLEKHDEDGSIQDGFLIAGGNRLTVYFYDFFEFKEECEELGIVLDVEDIFSETYASEKILVAAGWTPS